MNSNQDTDKLAIDGGAPSRQRKDPPMYPGGMLIDMEEEQAVPGAGPGHSPEREPPAERL
jgi:hypothetical protein